MFVVTGVTGRVGGGVAEILLAGGLPVRAVVRDAGKGTRWRERGFEVAAVPDARDAEALEQALSGAAGVFLMVPPDYDPEPGLPEVHRIAEAYRYALGRARPGRVVLLSTVGAQAAQPNLLNWGGILENALEGTGLPVAFLRAAWFMENAAWDVPAARVGRIESFLQPLDRAIEMVSVRDVGRTAADLLQDTWTGTRTIELSGPRRYCPNDVAKAFSAALGHPVTAVAVPRSDWEGRFRSEGMQHPDARISMLDGFNEGWIDFEHQGTEQRTGTVLLESVLRELVSSKN